MTKAFIALGANLGDRLATLQHACSTINNLSDTSVQDTSRLYESRAVGPGEQPNYLNAVIAIETSLSALQTLDALQAIETAMGRERTVRWGPRTLDLDILLFGALQIESDRLQIPHAQLFHRDFVLRPLLDIVPSDWRFPDQSLPADRLKNCEDNALQLFEGSLLDSSVSSSPEKGAQA